MWEPPEDDEAGENLAEFISMSGAVELEDGTLALPVLGEAERERNM